MECKRESRRRAGACHEPISPPLSDAKAAVAAIAELYERNTPPCARLSSTMPRAATSPARAAVLSLCEAHVRAPARDRPALLLRLHRRSRRLCDDGDAARHLRSLSRGADRPSRRATPASEIEVGESTTPIPIHFALGETFHVEGGLEHSQLAGCRKSSTCRISRSSTIASPTARSSSIDGARPLALFTAPRIDLSLDAPEALFRAPRPGISRIS